MLLALFSRIPFLKWNPEWSDSLFYLSLSEYGFGENIVQPMYYILIRLCNIFFNDTLISAHFINMIASMFIVYYTFLLAYNLNGIHTGIIASLLVTFYPHLYYISLTPSTESTFISFFLAGVYYFNLNRFDLSYFLFLLAFLTRFIGIAIFISLFFYMILNKPTKRIIVYSIPIILFIPYLKEFGIIFEFDLGIPIDLLITVIAIYGLCMLPFKIRFLLISYMYVALYLIEQMPQYMRYYLPVIIPMLIFFVFGFEKIRCGVKNPTKINLP